MKFRIQKNLLTPVLEKATMALPARSTSNILLGLFIQIDEGGNMTITGSDNEIRIEQTIQLTDYEPGQAILPGKLFTDIIRSMPDEEITVSDIENHLALIEASSSSFRIASLSAEEYPVSDTFTEEKAIKIDKETFIDMIHKTAFAASKVDSRGVLVGVLLDVKENEMTMVALDGFRMAVMDTLIENRVENPFKIIISARVLNKIEKLMDSACFEEKYITVGFNETKKTAGIEGENIKITTTLLNGKFMDYEGILPKEFATRVRLNKDVFKQSIDRAALMSTDGRNNLIKLKFTDDQLRIIAKSDSGYLEDQIPVSLEGKEIEIGFNAKYILDGLKVMDTEEIIFNLESSIKPCIILPADSHYIYMILPVRIL